MASNDTIPPPPEGYSLIPAPPEGYTLVNDIPPPPEGYTLVGNAAPSFMSKVKDAAIAAITPIPALDEGKKALIGNVTQTLGAARPKILAPSETSNPFAQAATAARNSLIPLPTPELAAGALELALPVSPLDLAGELTMGVLSPLTKSLAAKVMARSTDLPGIDKAAGLAGKASAPMVDSMEVYARANKDFTLKQARAETYFGKRVADLTAEQAEVSKGLAAEMAQVQAQAKATGPKTIAKLSQERQALQRELNAQANELRNFQKANATPGTKGAGKELELKQKGMDKTRAQIQAIESQLETTREGIKGNVFPQEPTPGMRSAQARLQRIEAELERTREAMRATRDTPAPKLPAVVGVEETIPFKTPKGAKPPAVPIDDIAATQKWMPSLDALKTMDTEEYLSKIVENPEFQKEWFARKGGVIPLETSRKGGDNLGLKLEDFAKLKKGQLPRGRADHVAAAAASMQHKASDSFYEAAQAYVNGASLRDTAEHASLAWEAIIGSKAVGSQYGRALRASSRVGLEERALMKLTKQHFKQSIMEDPAKLDQFLREIAALPKDAIAQRLIAAGKYFEPGNKWVAVFQEGRAGFLLSNPLTLMRNTVGNSMAVASNMVERPAAGFVNFLTAKLTGKPQEIMLGEGAANSWGMWSGLKAAAVDAIAVLKNETSLKGMGAELALRQGAIPGPLGKVIRTPLRLLNATDTFFRSILGSGELHRQAFRTAAKEGLEGVARAQRIEQLIANPTEEMLEAAINVSREFTFQSKLTGTLADIERGINRQDSGLGVVSKFVIPFFRTPVNVGKFVIERTPIISELTKRGMVRQAFLEKGITGAGFSEAVARNFVGAAALTSSWAALKANEGLITGAPPKDAAERENLYATGWRPYSVKLGDIYVPYRGFEPMASYLAAVADYAKFGRDNPEADMTQKGVAIMTNSLKNFVNQPFLTNIADVVDFMENPSAASAKSFALNQVAGVVPQGLAGMARAMDPTIRAPETVVEAMMARLPILSERVHAKLSRFGEPVQRTTYWFGLTDKPLAPGDPVEKTLRDLGIPKAVGFPETSMGGRSLNKTEFNQYLTATGKVIKPRIEMLLSQQAFRDAPKETKVAEIQGVVNDVRKQFTTILRPKVEMRHLNISADLDEVELRNLDDRILKTIDYQYLKDRERREVVNEYVRDAKRARQGVR